MDIEKPLRLYPILIGLIKGLVIVSQPSGHHGSFLRRLFLIAATRSGSWAAGFGPFADAYYSGKLMASRPEQRNTKPPFSTDYSQLA